MSIFDIGVMLLSVGASAGGWLYALHARRKLHEAQAKDAAEAQAEKPLKPSKAAHRFFVRPSEAEEYLHAAVAIHRSGRTYRTDAMIREREKARHPRTRIEPRINV